VQRLELEALLRLNGNMNTHIPDPPYQVARLKGQQALVDAILVVAVNLLVTDGAHALSMRRIANEAGCSTTVLYTLFGSKNGIVDALFQDGFARLAVAQHASVDDSHSPIQRLLRLCHSYRKTALENPTHYAIMFGSPVPDYHPSIASKELALAALQPLIDAVGRISSDQVQEKELNAREMAMILWATIHGLVSVEIAGMHLYPQSAEMMLESAVYRLLAL
jgi:AcrR family transcriptional regulator